MCEFSYWSSSSSSEETQDTEETGSTTGDAEPENSQDRCNQDSENKDQEKGGEVKVKEDKEREGATCKVCSKDETRNKDGHPEVLIHCAQCTSSGKVSVNKYLRVSLHDLHSVV